MPNQNGSGNNSDYNTARAFASTKFSLITNFNKNLLEKFHIILIGISSNFFINSEKFRSFCDITYQLFKHNSINIYSNISMVSYVTNDP